MKKIEEEILKCTRCPLYKSVNKKVVGDGNINSEIVFIGEAPGREEDLQGKPFVGKAGKLLTEMIENVLGLKRKDVYITNVLKCRPPNNRDPKIEEINACSIFLEKQLEIIKPRVIVCLGRFSTAWVLKYFGITKDFDFKISKYRGKVIKVNKWGREVIIFPTYHPAAILYRKNLIEEYKKDFEKIRELLKLKKKNKNLFDYVKRKTN